MANLLFLWISLLALTSFGISTPVRLTDPSRRPLVIWHGLGDSYASAGMLEFMQLIKDIHPGIFIHSVWLNEDLEQDQKAGFFGDVTEQLEVVSEQLAEIPELQYGFDAIGFSQGGQFLRAYIERYNAPPVNNLVTFGSQHMGVSDLPLCSRWDLFCQLARRYAARGGVYTEWAQHNLVQAQYYRDPAQLDLYLNSSRFLALVNNEVPEHINSTYADNLATLSNLVLVLFSADKTVVPKESAWFGSYASSNGTGDEKTIVPMRLQPLYTEDWIGLRTLDETGRVTLETCEGEHMQLKEECWKPLVERYTGEVVKDESDYRLVSDGTVFQIQN
ncbi:alpha/beta-hydrolase [Dichomitus squalens]|uniref:Palmitoyl-protein thioesterase 1 n=2 Tax=Dichomitus squalens TaxID=114155 RepID=A0A4Q9PI51_9APHY|nr:alpha/beta-hydrolase [Dichomitus squalens LYAD-421 SS1]EJF58190.1 alpha/beta-hydrolase [Dichomitus squalens LYAD-421 SS1]TBU30203.1 alpha/beta-hydrolase [Dichomitus squalens]TBU37076.1 alpha/beta-hydrolase [Dichomitus squalens]TBU53787.1 alpha/beta-hydrolase [Dichomitus squalens]